VTSTPPLTMYSTRPSSPRRTAFRQTIRRRVPSRVIQWFSFWLGRSDSSAEAIASRIPGSSSGSMKSSQKRLPRTSATE
jgi:hypothetical protein